MNTQQRWRKSSYSAPDNNCVEVAVGPTRTAIRDTKNRDAGALAMGARPFVAFLTAIKIGATDR